MEKLQWQKKFQNFFYALSLASESEEVFFFPLGNDFYVVFVNLM